MGCYYYHFGTFHAADGLKMITEKSEIEISLLDAQGNFNLQAHFVAASHMKFSDKLNSIFEAGF